MEKIVKSGERYAAVTLDGRECAVKFSNEYNVVSVSCDSEIGVALTSGKAVGDDGVMVCPAGGSVMYPHMRGLDTVYLIGSGNAKIFVCNEAVNPFKGGVKGGDGVNICGIPQCSATEAAPIIGVFEQEDL